MAYWHDRAATRAASLLWLLTLLCRITSALQTVHGSPCESVCSNAGSLEDDVVCLDANYQSLAPGRAFEACVSCQLNSTAVDTASNETDVEWALLALRYTLAGCMFAIPENHISISSPCQVSCAPLNASVGYQVTNDSSTVQPGNAFCSFDEFDDATINKCATCYSFIPQQIYLGNFLQALHIACRDPPIAGNPFFPDSNAIFNETLVAGPAPPSSNTGNSSGLHGWKLAIAIALPIVFGIIFFAGTCWTCFHFTRKRRQRMAQTGRMSRVHDAYADGSYYQSPMSGKAEAWKSEQLPWGVAEPPREMHAISPTLLQPKQPSPGFAQGRWSHHTGATTSEQNTPLRSSFQQDHVGPGPEQVRDPNLHEQFFGVGDEDDLPGPSGGHGYDPEDYQAHVQHHVQEHERGDFI